MKKLVDGLKIQNEKGNVEKENEIWTNRLEKNLKKYNIDIAKDWLVKTNNKSYSILSYMEAMDFIASKNLPMIYLNEKKHILLINDYKEEIEIIKALEEEEVNKIFDNLEDYQNYTKNELIQLNIIEG